MRLSQVGRGREGEVMEMGGEGSWYVESVKDSDKLATRTFTSVCKF